MQALANIPILLAQATPADSVEVVTEWRSLPEGWWAVAALAGAFCICWLVVAMYRREGRSGASSGLRLFLGGLRCVVLLALLAILLEPAAVQILRRWVDSYTLVLVDSSASMDLADVYPDEDAAARVQTFLAAENATEIRRRLLAETLLARDNRAFLTGLALNNRVKLYRFGQEPELLGTVAAARDGVTPMTSAEQEPGAAAPSPEAPALLHPQDVPVEIPASGPTTNLERAVRRALESIGGAPLAGVVVISDGGFNEGASAEAIAAITAQRRVPVHVVGVGDPSEPRNARVAEVTGPENAFQSDPFVLTARLATQGLEGSMLRVKLLERDETSGTPAVIVEQRDVVVGPGGAVEELRFDRGKDRVGRFTFSVEVEPVVGESVLDDNVSHKTVNVMDTRTRVLLVAGGPSWEYRYLARLLQRDDAFEVSCWLQSADLSAVRDGDVVIDHFPRYVDELYAYDVIILLDPDRREFDNDWARLVDRLVSEHGGGLLLAAARAYTPAFLRDPELQPLHDLLPVTLDPEADLIINEIGHYQREPAPVILPEGAHNHPVLQLADDPVSSRLLWQTVAQVYWHYPVLREKPVATVLLRHGDPRMANSHGPHVLGAVQYVGAGRTAFLGFDSTWRWRQYGSELHDRFWVQMLRFLAEGRLLSGTQRAVLYTDGDRFSVGDTITVTARLLDDRFEPLLRDRVTAEYEIDGQRRPFALNAERDRPGWYSGQFVADRTGACRIWLQLTQPDGALLQAGREVRILRPNLEVANPQMDLGKLQTLARASGGQYFSIDQAGQLPALIPDVHEEVPIRSRPRALWDNAYVLALLVGLLSVEWFLRRWNQLL